VLQFAFVSPVKKELREAIDRLKKPEVASQIEVIAGTKGKQTTLWC
jgi:folylpolyglutamate synthase/dihydropteroate synthase